MVEELKEKEIRFRALYPAKLEVFLDTGPTVYNCTQEAMDDLWKRGLMLDEGEAAAPARNTSSTRPRQPNWETADAKSQHCEAHLKHIQENLKGV